MAPVAAECGNKRTNTTNCSRLIESKKQKKQEKSKKNCPKTVQKSSKLSKNCRKIVEKCPKIVQKLSKNCPNCPKMFKNGPKMSKNGTKIVGLSENCPNCSKVSKFLWNEGFFWGSKMIDLCSAVFAGAVLDVEFLEVIGQFGRWDAQG